MRTVWDILYTRRPVLNYISPPVCEVIFSGSSSPVIVLSEEALTQVFGLTLGGVGGFQLSWNVFPGAICYNVYFIGGDNVAVLLASCISDPNFLLPDDLDEGSIVVTAITPEGETPPSDPIPYPSGGGPISVFSVRTDCKTASRPGTPAVFTIYRQPGDIDGDVEVSFTLTGTAVNGTDYVAVPLSVTVPDGSEFAFVDIDPTIEPLVLLDVILTLTVSGPTVYQIAPPTDSTVDLRPPAQPLPLPVFYKVLGYGGATPLFTPNPVAVDSEECEWDGTFTREVFTGFTDAYRFADDFGNPSGPQFPLVSIQGKGRMSAVVEDIGVDATVSITVRESNNFQRSVWNGIKPGGGGLAGTYARNDLFSNSDQRPFVTIIAGP